MNQIEKLLIDLELARNEVTKWDGKRLSLLDECENAPDIDHICQVTGEHYTTRGWAVCLTNCYSETLARSNEEGYVKFEEVLDANEEGEYCQHCIQSYKIKINQLASARKAYGVLKRRVISAGKKLIKEHVSGS